MGIFDAVPIASDIEDAAGTVATGAADTFVADPVNGLLGVDAPDMGIFEEGEAGARVVSIGSAGLAGDSGLITDPGGLVNSMFGGGGGGGSQAQAGGSGAGTGLAGWLPIAGIAAAAAAVYFGVMD
jgi:hypothetical protein